MIKFFFIVKRKNKNAYVGGISLCPDLEVDIEAIDVGSIHVIVELQTVLLISRDISRHQSGTVIQVSRTRTLNEYVPALCCKCTIESWNFQISIFFFLTIEIQLRCDFLV